MNTVRKRMLRTSLSLAGALALVTATPELVAASGADATADAQAEVTADAEQTGADTGTEPRAEVDAGADAEIAVTARDCDSVDVTSTKDISNVVVVFSDGSEQRFDGINQTSWSFDGDGETVAALYVKSGNNGTDAGPGYGELVDVDEAGCETDTAVGGEAQTDTEGDVQTGVEVEGGTEADVEGDVAAEVRGDRAVRADSGIEAGVGAEVMGDVQLPAGAEVLAGAGARAAAAPSTAVGASVLSAGATPDSSTATGSSTGTLPMTGADDTLALAAAGAALLLGGIGAERLARQRAVKAGAHRG